MEIEVGWEAPFEGIPEQVIKKHTIIELEGYPFYLAEDTKVLGGYPIKYTKENTELISQKI
ncbi:hypothetical protein [Leptospira licerasiae]|uniref:hypothetical protein n=1 Tax=Leptospira licerasiae TaxID=447106 RepID=UPI00301630D2